MRKIWPLLSIIVVAILAMFMFFAPWQAWRIDYLPLGDKGLELWLLQHDIAVQRAKRHDNAAKEDLSLRLMPFPYFEDSFKGINDDLPRMDQERFIDKIFEIPSLIVVPKWYPSQLEDEVATQFDLLPLSQLNKNMALAIDKLRLHRPVKDFIDEDITPKFAPIANRSYQIKLYQPQVFDPDTLPNFCYDVLGISQGALLLYCDAGQSLYFLSDPDLLNNHGLTLGEHADLAVAILRTIRGEEDLRPIYFDNNADLLRGENEEEQEGKDYERNSEDLARMFDYPLSIIWGLMLLLLMVSLWRGFYRFGPPQRNASSHIELSKTAAVTATARLLLRSRNDSRMVAGFVHNLLLNQAARHLGTHCANEAGIERLLARFERRNKAQGLACRALIASLMYEKSAHHARDLRHKLAELQQFIKEF